MLVDKKLIHIGPGYDDLLVNMSASHEVGCGFTSLPGHTKVHHRNCTNCLPALYAGIKVGV